ncbi:hypothetical protein P879_05390 [Paragonimus westermani]|uniref:RNA helicase n=1 Tax=Paragonimus westermani TaxID=34504 RepID=A0A8T0DIW8_9TREM|nr:hypothetical protein P879_05390 [Paragonimus westermani]
MHQSQTIESTDQEETSYLTTVGLAHRLDEEKKRTADVLFSAPQKDATSETTKTLSVTRFADMRLSSSLLRGLSEAGFLHPSPVQIKAIPLGRMGLDMIVQAKSGTGKTVVFVVVLLEAIDPQRPVLQALVLSPTREIALQSQTVFQRLGAHIPGLKCQLFVGGLPLADDLCRLQQCHIAVGTPGRVRYLIETGYMSVDQVRHLVLDEADLLLAGGAEAKLTGGSTNNAFPADVNYIWWSLPQNKQMLALSATYTDYLVEEHLQRYMNHPALVRLVSHDPALLGVRQFFLLISPPDRSPASVFAAKVNTLCKLLSSVEFQQCLIFSNFHNSAQDLCDALHSRGWPVSYISSNLDQEQRFRAFNRLRAFHCRVLVSTDLTSRGIDAENVNLVVSLEVPWEHEIYVHRVGRAGRFGSYGASVLIVADVAEEKHLLKRLQSKCPTNINQLPDPVPADLAHPDCSVDLDSLVTVVNCLGDVSNRGLPQKRRNQHTSNAPPVASHKHDRLKQMPVEQSNHKASSADENGLHRTQVTAKRTQDSCSPPMVPSSQLPNLLAEYLHSIKLSLFETDCSQTNVSHLNALESSLLQQLDDYMNKAIPLCNQQDTHGFEQTQQSLPEKQFMPPRKEFPKHVHHSVIEPVTTGPTLDICGAELKKNLHPAEIQWTAQQIAAWYKYHELANYARSYYSCWQSAINEYTVIMKRLTLAKKS